MNEPATESPKPIHSTGTNASGAVVSRGYHGVGPSGQLVLIRPGTPLKPGWRFATKADIDAAEAAEAKRRAKDKSGEHDERDRQAARSAAKRTALDAATRNPELDALTSPT
jgi:hypothetical protein